MAESVAKKQVCTACGADVRKGSVFCYSCGETLVPAQMTLTETPVEKKNGGRPADIAIPVADATLPFSMDRLGESEGPATKAAESRPGLRSASSMRGKVKAYNRKAVEITWDARERSPVAYAVASVVLAVFAAVMLVLAWYLK